MKKRIGVMALVCVSVCLAGFPVYDWTAAINATKQISELVKMYDKIRDQYEQMYFQAKYMYGRSRYNIRHSPWKILDFSTRSRVTDVWRDTVNASGRAREAWERASARLNCKTERRLERSTQSAAFALTACSVIALWDCSKILLCRTIPT
jgi:hypothetical protein